jgi:thiol-disulfide isomerase/thioredoxin
MFNQKILMPFVLVFMLATVSCGGPGKEAAELAKTPVVQASKGTVTSLKTYDFSANDGKVVFVELWGVWCPPCIRSMPHVQETWEKYRENDDFSMMVVNTGWRGDNPKKVASWLKQNSKYSFPVYFEDRPQPEQFATKGKVQSIPRSLILDKSGDIAYNGHPMQVPEGLIEKLLAK